MQFSDAIAQMVRRDDFKFAVCLLLTFVSLSSNAADNQSLVELARLIEVADLHNPSIFSAKLEVALVQSKTIASDPPRVRALEPSESSETELKSLVLVVDELRILPNITRIEFKQHVCLSRKLLEAQLSTSGKPETMPPLHGFSTNLAHFGYSFDIKNSRGIAIRVDAPLPIEGGCTNHITLSTALNRS